MYQKALLTLIAVATLTTASLAAPLQTPADTPSAPAPIPAWRAAILSRLNELIQKNGPGTNTVLRDQLLKMADEDHVSRGIQNGKQSSVTKEMAQQIPASDARLTAELQLIVKQNGWPTISLVGIDASNAAMLILSHTRDHDWQRQLLPQLQSLADADKIDGSQLAMTVDKELVADGKLQRYGSQFKYFNGSLAMYAVEDPGDLDQRRAKALLPPITVYRQALADMYHIKASDDVVMATPPPKK